MRAVGAYIFAGGFTLGVRRHFDVECVLEADDYGVAVARQNQPTVRVHVGRASWPIEALKAGPRVDFLYGNPPCAAWSAAGASMKAGVRRDWRKDARVECTRVHFGLAEELRPRAWAWESVPQAFTEGREFVDELTRRAAAMDYRVTYLLHNAMYLGVPQNRRRFFFVMTDCEFDVQPPSWETQSCANALRQINDPGKPMDYHIGRYAHFLHEMKPGEDVRHTWERITPKPWATHANGFVKGRPPFTIKKPRPDGPANVVMHEMVHPTEPRALSMKELALLTGYPRDYEWPDEYGSHSLVARGVCPPVGAWLAENVRRCLERNSDAGPRVQVIDVSKPPGSRQTLQVPGERTEQEPAADVRLRTDGDAGDGIPTAPVQPETADDNRPDASSGLTRSAEGSEAAQVALAPPPTLNAGAVRVVNIRPRPGVGSGAFIRWLLMTGQFTTEEILKMVHDNYPGSKAGPSDVSWNRGKLRKAGATVPEVRR